MIHNNSEIQQIIFPHDEYQKLIEHCLRKLKGEYLAEESQEKKAYGLVGGKYRDNELLIELVQPLYKNCRASNGFKKYMDDTLSKYAAESETPMEKRGWVASPLEIKEMLNTCNKRGIELVANYHMHRVPWAHDLQRDTPTLLDKVLAENSGLFTFIISTVNPQKISVRAFYEGNINNEINITLL